MRFDAATEASVYSAEGGFKPLPDYPKSWPAKSFPDGLYSPTGEVDTLGHLETDEAGRLVVLGGYGRASAWKQTDGSSTSSSAASTTTAGSTTPATVRFRRWSC